MADVKWIKIVTDIFDDEKILLIENLPAADSIITIWFKLLCLAGKQNNSGVFVFANRIPYTDQMLATIFRRELPTVQLALRTFQEFGMIEVIDGVITIPNWEKHQNIEALEKQREGNRIRQAKYKEKQKLLAMGNGESNVTGNVTDNVTQGVTQDVTQRSSNALDKNRIDKNRLDENREDSKPVRHKYGYYKNVLLSDQDLEKLRDEFPLDWQDRIDRLSEYMTSTGKSYKNHLATIRAWARKDGNQAQQAQPQPQQVKPQEQPQRKGAYFQNSYQSISYDDWEKYGVEVDD